MKTFFQILFVLCLPFVGMAQGNLQFNQVRFIQYDTTINLLQGQSSPTIVLSKIIVVPQNKVLKIENIDYAANAGIFGYQFLFNSLPLLGNTAGNGISSFPIWLPSGSYNIKFTGGGVAPGTGSSILWVRISALEFNITP